MNDLDVASADANKDGVLTSQEKINAKSMLYDNKIVKPKDVLSTNELINFIFQQKSETIDDIIDENIRFDKNKDGKVSVNEVKKGLNTQNSGGKGDILAELYKKLSEIDKQIKELSKNEEANRNMIENLIQEKIKIMGEIKKILQERLKKAI